jgi:hypothetical protein
MNKVLILLLLISVLLLFINTPSRFGEQIDDLINYKDKENDAFFANTVRNMNPSTDILVKDYGCFRDLDEKFFIKKLNPFTTTNSFDSAFVVSPDTQIQDFEALFTKITENGFAKYIETIKSKYSPKDYKNITIPELGALALFAGYSYISMYRESKFGNLKIYFSYSPPMDKHNIVGQFNTKEYSKLLSKTHLNNKVIAGNNELQCGYPCTNPDRSPQVNQDGKVYTCGSINYPTIKSPSIYSVYYISIT